MASLAGPFELEASFAGLASVQESFVGFATCLLFSNDGLMGRSAPLMRKKEKESQGSRFSQANTPFFTLFPASPPHPFSSLSHSRAGAVSHGVPIPQKICLHFLSASEAYSGLRSQSDACVSVGSFVPFDQFRRLVCVLVIPQSEFTV